MATTENIKNISEFDDKSLLIVDDDNPFRERLARAMEKKICLTIDVQRKFAKHRLKNLKKN